VLGDGTKVDITEFKRKMVEQYERQLKENEELLRKRREEELQNPKATTTTTTTTAPTSTSITAATTTVADTTKRPKAVTSAVPMHVRKMQKGLSNIQITGIKSESRVMVCRRERERETEFMK
jgi:molecular chaperone GrpE (heat shock protein)